MKCVLSRDFPRIGVSTPMPILEGRERDRVADQMRDHLVAIANALP